MHNFDVCLTPTLKKKDPISLLVDRGYNNALRLKTSLDDRESELNESEEKQINEMRQSIARVKCAAVCELISRMVPRLLDMLSAWDAADESTRPQRVFPTDTTSDKEEHLRSTIRSIFKPTFAVPRSVRVIRAWDPLISMIDHASHVSTTPHTPPQSRFL